MSRKAGMVKQPVKIGIVGLQHGQAHLADLKEHAGFQVEAVCDRDKDKLEGVVRKHNLDSDMAFVSYEKMLGKAHLDAVFIATPVQFHAAMAMAAVSQGLHVLLDKPLTHDLESALRLYRVVKDSNAVFQVGFEMRSSALVRKIKEIVDSGQLGEVVFLWVTQFRGLGNYTEWRSDRHLGGGQFFDCLVHEIDMFLYLLGSDFYRVMAFGAPKGKIGPNSDDVPDTVAACIEFQNAVRASIGSSQISQSTNNTHFGIVGTEGRIDADPWLPEGAGSLWLYTQGGLFRTQVIISGDKTSTGHLGHSEQHSHFFASIRENGPNMCSIESALKTQTIMTAFDKSMAENRPVLREEFSSVK